MPLPIFISDLAPETINKEIFNITSLLNTNFKVKESHKRPKFPNDKTVSPTAKQKAIAHTYFAVLNVVNIT
jgi:hypothetical protein